MPAGSKPGRRHEADADRVGLLLELALVLELRRGSGRDRARAERRVHERQEDAEQRAVVDERGLLLLADGVVGGDVDELVCQDPRELGLARDPEDEPAVDVDVARPGPRRRSVFASRTTKKR